MKILGYVDDLMSWFFGLPYYIWMPVSIILLLIIIKLWYWFVPICEHP